MLALSLKLERLPLTGHDTQQAHYAIVIMLDQLIADFSTSACLQVPCALAWMSDASFASTHVGYNENRSSNFLHAVENCEREHVRERRVLVRVFTFVLRFSVQAKQSDTPSQNDVCFSRSHGKQEGLLKTLSRLVVALAFQLVETRHTSALTKSKGLLFKAKLQPESQALNCAC